MRQLLDSLCYWFDLDGENCSSTVKMSPLGPMCMKHQREMWKALNR